MLRKRFRPSRLKLKILVSSYIIFSIFLGCRRDEAGTSVSSIIGKNDLTIVNNDGSNLKSLNAQKLIPLLDAVARLEIPGGSFCTVYHIGNGIGLTSGHCFKKMGVSKGAETVKNLNCDGVVLKFGYRKGNTNILNSKCTGIIAAQLINERVNIPEKVEEVEKGPQTIQPDLTDYKDFAVIRFSPYPKASFHVANPVSGNANKWKQVTMLSHNMGRFLEFPGFCIASFDSNLGQRIRYECDTEPASSGSGLINYETSEIIGINGTEDGFYDKKIGKNMLSCISEPPMGMCKEGTQVYDKTPYYNNQGNLGVSGKYWNTAAPTAVFSKYIPSF